MDLGGRRLFVSIAAFLCLAGVAVAEERTEEDAYREADQMIAAHIHQFPCDHFELEGPSEQTAARLEYPFLCHLSGFYLGEDHAKREGLWVAGVDLWTGVCFRNGCLRLYRFANGNLEILDTQEGTALFRASQGEWGAKHEGSIQLCLRGSVDEVKLDPGPGCLGGPVIESRHGHMWSGGHSVEATVRWIVVDNRLRSFSLEYDAEPHVFSGDRHGWDRSEYQKRDILSTASDTLSVVRTESVTPWFECLDTLLAACTGSLPLSAARGIATDKQVKRLWKYQVNTFADDDNPTVVWRSDDECEMTCGMYLLLADGQHQKEGTMHFHLRRVGAQWTLASFSFRDVRTVESPR